MKPQRTYGNGHYTRSPGGTWTYTATGEPVHGAEDLRVQGKMLMWAPELHPDALLTVERAAALCGVKTASFRRMLARGQVPPPVLHVGYSPVWTAGVLDVWMRTRPAAQRAGASKRGT